MLPQLSRRLALVILLSLGLSACGGGGGSSSGAGASSGGILVLGDSISNGFTTTEAYPNILGRETGFPVVNKSITGGQAETVVSPIRFLLNKYRPKYVIILLGTNNARNGNIQTAFTSIEFAARVSIEAGAIPVIGTLPHIFNNSFHDRRAGDLSNQIAGIPGSRIVNIRGVINKEDLTTDGIHPNVVGQTAIAREFARFIN